LTVRAAIVGVGGYTGRELWRILLAHPEVDLVLAVSDQLAGANSHEILGGVDRHRGARPVVPREALNHLEAGAVDVAFLATPAEVSLALAPQLLKLGTKVIDLSGAFRFPSPEPYPLWYGFEHEHANLLKETHRGIPEWVGAPKEGTRLIANPGCYPTATAIGLTPFVRAGLGLSQSILVEGKSGATGAGRKGDLHLSVGEAGESIVAYGYPRHRHAPEMEELLGGQCRVAFVPHLLSVRRGLLITAHIQIQTHTLGNEAAKVLEDPTGHLFAAYNDKQFIRVLSDRFPSFRDVVGSNLAAVRAVFDQRTETLSVFCAIDNLLKGAAGQAIQHMNLLMGLEADAGLHHLSFASA
jgi:N-acetyl-gamma-glutamyl-phosphate reductase